MLELSNADYGDEEDDEKEMFVECNGVGNPVHIDVIQSRKFFLEYCTGNLHVKVGDCVIVRVCPENNSVNKGKSNFVDESPNDLAYGQVLAVYEDETEEMYIEVKG